MTTALPDGNLLGQLDSLNEQQLRRLLVEHLTKQKLGLYWEASAIERDRALNADIVLPRLVAEWSHRPAADKPGAKKGSTAGSDFTHRNLIIEGDNFDTLRLLQTTYRGKASVSKPAINTPYCNICRARR